MPSPSYPPWKRSNAALHRYVRADLARLCEMTGAGNAVLRDLLTTGDGPENDVVPEIVGGW